mmetsp:Transcript_105281/g.296446  ORF Transcript_105281/g.296446 Transcript_105281/m.296446 type:complete len:203 (-) Transcript_105281:57-665(-)
MGPPRVRKHAQARAARGRSKLVATACALVAVATLTPPLAASFASGWPALARAPTASAPLRLRGLVVAVGRRAATGDGDDEAPRARAVMRDADGTPIIEATTERETNTGDLFKALFIGIALFCTAFFGGGAVFLSGVVSPAVGVVIVIVVLSGLVFLSLSGATTVDGKQINWTTGEDVQRDIDWGADIAQQQGKAEQRSKDLL